MKSKLVKTEGIVLRSIPYRESSSILTFLTKNLGKIKGIAKGRRRPNSRLRVPLELLTRSELILYLKEEREIHTVKEASTITSYDIFRRDYKRFYWGCRMAEITDTLIDTGSPIPRIYNLFIQSLDLISILSEPILPNILLGFTLKTLSFLGHKPVLEKCVKCGNKVSLNYVSISEGGTVCENCSFKLDDVTPYSKNFIKSLKILISQPQNSLSQFKLEYDRLEEFIFRYVEYVTGRSIEKERK